MTYGFKDLLARFKEEGLAKSKGALQKLIRDGRLLLPRNMMNGRYLILPEQVEEIITAFKPGGDGKWIFNPDDND